MLGAAEARREGSVGSAGRRGDIQGLRAVAVLLVVVYHSGIGLPGGFVGVDVFFVISGYVITRMLTNELGGSGRLDLKRFYLRRIRRLLPALGVMLSVVLVASVLLASLGGQKLTARTGAAAALFNANTYLMRAGGGGYFDVSADLNALLHTWSLSVEEQFYLVFPALLFAAWVIGRRLPRIGSVRAAVIMLALISGLSFVLGWATTNGHSGPLPIGGFVGEFAFYSSPTRAWEFAVGGLLALGSKRLTSLSAVVSAIVATSGAALIAFAAVGFDAATRFPGTAALVPAVGTLLVLAAGESGVGNPLNRALAIRPAQYLGDLSYSWYLWHWPCIVFAAALWPTTSHTGLIAAAFSLFPAVLSYRFIESPIRFAPRVPARRTLALASACILLPLASAVVLEGGNVALRRSDTVVQFDEAFRHHEDYVRGCDKSVTLGGRDQPECTWRVDNPVGLALLVGDSNAGHFTEAFVGAANAEGMDATVATLSACPFVDLIVARNGVSDPECQMFVSDTVQRLIDLRPTVVVIASSSDSWIEFDEIDVQRPGDSTVFSTPGEKASVWVEGLARVIKPLEATGVEVIVVHPAPKLSDWDPRNCAVGRVLTDQSACAASVTRAQADQYRARAVLAESRAAEMASAVTLDVADQLCPDGLCAALQNGIWRWRDSNHVSVAASTGLVSVFRRLFKDR